MELVFATNNQHKIDEVQAMIGEDAAIRIKSLEAIGCLVDIPETGETFEENSRQKSRFVWENYNLPCFADDSGLEVDALNGEPGVYSARYSGSRDMEQNIALVLKKMEGVQNRRARFRTVISLLLEGEIHLFEGAVEGVLLEKKMGAEGFGYDPLFVPDGFVQTFAEMSAGQKNQLSHRGEAVRKMVEFLTNRI